MDQDSWQPYLEATRNRDAAAKPRAGASSAINAHCDALQNAKFVPVMPSPRMLLPAASADDQTREPRATKLQESSNEHVNGAQRPGSHQTRIRTGTHFGDPHYCNHHVAAARDDARKLTPDITKGQVTFTAAIAISIWSVQFNHLPCIWQETGERKI